jgi:SAM-dependent methyltransferase
VNKKIIALSFTLILIVVLSGFIAHSLLDFVESDTLTKNYSFTVDTGSGVNIVVPQFNVSDRIYLVLNSSSRMNIEPSPTLKQLPYDIEGAPYQFEDWILFEQRFCLIANDSSSSSILHLSFLDPQIPYSVKVFEGQANYTLLNSVDNASADYIGVHIQALANQSSRFQQVMFIYPYNEVAEQNFQVHGSLKLIDGNISSINFIIITTDRDWLPYTVVSSKQLNVSNTFNFDVNLDNQTIFGRTLSEDFGKQIQYIAVSIILDSLQWQRNQMAYADVGVGEIKLTNGNESTIIEPTVLEEYPVNCDLYVFSKFHPTAIYTISLLMLVFLVLASALMLAQLSGFKFQVGKLFGPLITSEALSDPRPNTYLAKLFHKPRYDQLVALLQRFAGRKVNILIDVGCGKGVFQDYLTKNSIDVDVYIGCDVNRETLREVSNIERVLCDVQHMPFKQNIADVAVCSEVLEHTTNPNLGFSQLLDVSKNWLFVSIPLERLKNALGFRYPEHISEPNPSEFKQLAENSRFELIKREKKTFAFPPSIFDKLGLRYDAFYRPIIVFLFQILSMISWNFSLIKTVILVFRLREN